MKPPERVSLPPFSVSIARVDLEGADSSGLYMSGAQTIRIERSLEPNQARTTLFHELMHFAIDHSGLDVDLGEKREEAVCRRLAPLLVALLRENPQLVRYLVGGPSG